MWTKLACGHNCWRQAIIKHVLSLGPFLAGSRLAPSCFFFLFCQDGEETERMDIGWLQATLLAASGKCKISQYFKIITLVSASVLTRFLQRSNNVDLSLIIAN